MRRLVFVPVVLTACSEPGLKAFNASPEVLIAAPTDGETVSAAVAVTLRGVVSDPDGPLDGLEAAWRVDDVQVCAPEPPDAEGLVACETVLAPGSRVITLQARDAGGAAGADSVSVTAASDAAGVTLDVVVTPTEARTDDVLTATVQVTEGAAAAGWTLAWLVDGEDVGETGETLDGAEAFDKGQSVVAEATLDGVSWSSAAVVVANTPPGAPVLSLALYGDYHVCELAEPAVDADGDAVDYRFEWSMDGTVLTGADTVIRTGDAMPADALTGTSLQCTATPFDDEADGEPASVSGAVCGVGRGTELCPGRSCAQLLADGMVTTSGLVWLDTDADPMQVYCELDLETGGWALAGSYTFDTWADIDGADADQVQTGGGDPVLPDDTIQRLRFFDVLPHDEVLVSVSKNGAAPEWVRVEGDVSDVDSEAEICGNHGTGAPRYCTTAPAYAFETSSGDTGLCGGGNGNTNWVRSEGHDYDGQSASYLYVCGYGPSVCPPNGYGGCGYADSALRGTEAESATTWGREGDGFVVRFYLR